jgi:poly(hydroxyalkanoate) depolymerase family esterase
MNVIAEEQTCFVVYPAQPSDANPAKCWNWFRPTDQRRGQGEPSLIAGITRQVMRDYWVDPRRVYIGGLSAGAAAAAVMGATYPDLYAAIGVHSGLACGAANDLPSAFVAMRQGDLAVGNTSAVREDGPVVPTIVFHGDRDTTVHPRNGDRVIALSMGTTNSRKTVHRGRVPGGHAYTRTIHADASGQPIFEHWEIHGAGPRMVGRHPCRLLHRSARAGRCERDGALLPRALATHGAAVSVRASVLRPPQPRCGKLRASEGGGTLPILLPHTFGFRSGARVRRCGELSSRKPP